MLVRLRLDRTNDVLAFGRQIGLESVLVRAGPLLFAGTQRFERRTFAKDLGRAFDKLGPGAPDAGALVGLAAVVVNVLTKRVGGGAMIIADAAKLLRDRALGHFFHGLLIRFRGGKFAAQEGVERVNTFACLVQEA